MLTAAFMFVFSLGACAGYVLGCIAQIKTIEDQDRRIRLETEDWFARQRQAADEETG